MYDGVHDFFNDSDVHPNNWTPLNFANYPSANNFSDYTAGLAKLRRGGTSAIHKHAGDIVRWLRNEENSLLIEQAKLRIIEKIEAQNSVLVANARKYTDAQYISAAIYHTKRPRSTVRIYDYAPSMPSVRLYHQAEVLDSFHRNKLDHQANQPSQASQRN